VKDSFDQLNVIPSKSLSVSATRKGTELALCQSRSLLQFVKAPLSQASLNLSATFSPVEEKRVLPIAGNCVLVGLTREPFGHDALQMLPRATCCHLHLRMVPDLEWRAAAGFRNVRRSGATLAAHAERTVGRASPATTAEIAVADSAKFLRMGRRMGG